MDNAQSILLKSGGKDQMVCDFSALREATTLEGHPKYNERPTLENLAKFLCAQGSGPNKDSALYELSLLIYAVSERLGPDQLTDFFLSPTKATPNFIRAFFPDEDGEKITLTFSSKSFDIRFGRMPFLVALYEFLVSMDNFAHFEAINGLVGDLTSDNLTEARLKTCANGLGAILRKYRIAYLTTAQADGKFGQVYKFLQENQAENQLIIHDQSIFDFWCLHNSGKDYRGYRTVFDLFCDFTRSFEEAERQKAAHDAPRLGVNVEDGEIDLALEDIDDATQVDWSSPFDLFDRDEFSDLRFFKKKTERAPIETLMAHGPEAIRWPHAFIRYEIFGQVQSGITNDLQVGRGKESVERRMTCEDVQSYNDRIIECEGINTHIKTLQAACLHILSEGSDNVVSFPGPAKEIGQKAFKKLNRKGFDEKASERRDEFSEAADALVKLQTHLERYLLSLQNQKVTDKFEEDRNLFKNQFGQLYAEALK